MNNLDVTIENLDKYFYSIKRGKIVALKDINLGIENSEFFVILGPSGCGKSTLLNIIAGLEKPSSGEVWFGKNLICSTEKKQYLSPKQRNVAMVFQSYALYPHMTVFGNIAFPLRIAKYPKNEVEKRVIEVAEKLSIEQLLAVKPRELSGGQRQRVAMARAIIRRPRLFLLDEPLSNLDAKLRVRMRSELKTLQQKIGITTIYVTHDQTEAMTLGDRIAILKDGEIQQIGKPLEVYNCPRNTFVAGFLGAPPMNLINAKILEKDKKLYIIVKDMEILFPNKKIPLLRKLKNQIILGIRPEHISIVKPRKKISFGKEIKFVEHLGNEVILHFQLNEQEILVKLTQDYGFKEGESVELDIDLEKIHIFDQNGLNIEEDTPYVK